MWINYQPQLVIAGFLKHQTVFSASDVFITMVFGTKNGENWGDQKPPTSHPPRNSFSIAFLKEFLPVGASQPCCDHVVSWGANNRNVCWIPIFVVNILEVRVGPLKGREWFQYIQRIPSGKLTARPWSKPSQKESSLPTINFRGAILVSGGKFLARHPLTNTRFWGGFYSKIFDSFARCWHFVESI